jgi:3-phosphoshikimate 1-carboxyvinyltransferase
MAMPVMPKNSRIRVKNLKSKPYIDLTLDLLNTFGIIIEHDNYETFFTKGSQNYSAEEYIVEGDWSGASFFLVWGAVKGSVCIEGLNIRSKQADRAILDVLNAVGAKVSLAENSVTVEKGSLNSFEFSIEDCPDLLPPLVTLATFCRGKSIIHGTKRLQYKESNRTNALFEEFSKIGANIVLNEDSVEIIGSDLTSDRVYSHDDHRIAMALMTAGANVMNPDCIKKSYPGFFKDYLLLTNKR